MSKEIKPIEKTSLDIYDMEDVFLSIMKTKNIDYAELRNRKILNTNANAHYIIQKSLASKTGKVARIGEKVGLDTEFLSAK